MLRQKIFGWSPADLATYQMAYHKFGGGVNTHPDVLEFIIRTTALKADFWAYQKKGELLGACFTTEQSKGGFDVWRSWPVTHDEFLFPLSSQHYFLLPMYSNRLAPEHKNNVRNSTFRLLRKAQNCRVKQTFSAKNEKSRRNEVNRFIRNGGDYRSVDSMTGEELATIFVSLFTKRFGNTVKEYELSHMCHILTALKHMLFGHVLYINGEPCAYDLIFMSESPTWIYFDVPNGGLDPKYHTLSIGSVLMWLNITTARELCHQRGKEMKFSLGHYSKNWHYKLRWAEKYYVGKIIF